MSTRTAIFAAKTTWWTLLSCPFIRTSRIFHLDEPAGSISS